MIKKGISFISNLCVNEPIDYSKKNCCNRKTDIPETKPSKASKVVDIDSSFFEARRRGSAKSRPSPWRAGVRSLIFSCH